MCVSETFILHRLNDYFISEEQLSLQLSTDGDEEPISEEPEEKEQVHATNGDETQVILNLHLVSFSLFFS